MPTRPQTREEKIDEFGRLDWEIRAVRLRIARHHALRQEILEWFEQHPPDQPVVLQGAAYTLEVSAREFHDGSQSGLFINGAATGARRLECVALVAQGCKP
jgi:hypothetical protein